MNLTLKNDLSEIERLAREVAEFGKAHEMPERAVFNLNLVLEEIVANIISYGYDDDNEHSISVDCTISDQKLSLTITDDGKSFNPLEAKAPELDKPLEEREIGGLGIYLVKHFMDNVEYTRDRDRNILTLSKALSPDR